jgi:hypothetical protein
MTPPDPDAELTAVEHLELSLLDPAVRADRARVEALLADDVTEIGASGRVWDRASIVDALARDPAVCGHAVDVVASRVTADVVLVTYRLEGSAPSVRSSVWVRGASGWRLRFHQGTPTSG